MDVHGARKWLIYASLVATLLAFLFFLIAPVLGFPLTFEQSLRLLELVVPVFLGYLGTSTRFLVRGTRARSANRSSRAYTELLAILVRGPVIVFSISFAGALIAFGVSNDSSAPPGAGMSLDTLAVIFTAELGLLTATTSLLVPALFLEEAVGARSGESV
jgi:hypothetical protein